jgi:hypothetical protein
MFQQFQRDRRELTVAGPPSLQKVECRTARVPRSLLPTIRTYPSVGARCHSVPSSDPECAR